MDKYIISTYRAAIPHIIDASNIFLQHPLCVYIDDIYYKGSFYFEDGSVDIKSFINTKRKIYVKFRNTANLETPRGMYKIREEEYYNVIINKIKPDYYQLYNKNSKNNLDSAFIYNDGSDFYNVHRIKNENKNNIDKNEASQSNSKDKKISNVNNITYQTIIGSDKIEKYKIFEPENIDEAIKHMQNNNLISTKFINEMVDNGILLTENGKNISVRDDYRCHDCCKNYHAEYLLHLFDTNEINAKTIMAIHNYKKLHDIATNIK